MVGRFRMGPCLLLFLAAPAAMAQDLLLEIASPVPAAAFGSSVALAGDLDGDGIPDLAVGAPFDTAVAEPEGAGFQGSAWLFSGADGALLAQLAGAHASALFGWSVAAAGDMDGDGVPEVAIGAPNYDAFRGRVVVVSGADGALLFEAIGDSPGDRFGWAVAGVGDFDGDGLADLAVGAFDDDQPLPGSGSVRVLDGNGVTLAEVGGDMAGDHLGTSVAGLGDADLDGFPDILTGGITIDGAKVDAGGVVLLAGLTAQPLWAQQGDHPDGHLGHAVAGAGDVDGDGVPDALAGAPDVNSFGVDNGRVKVLSGVDGAILLQVEGPHSNARLGTAVASAGDVDGDGVPDVAAGAPKLVLPDKPGGVLVCSGADGSTLYTLTAGIPAAGFGSGLDVGDVDGDGSLDLLVGAPEGGLEPAGAGIVRLFSGNAWLEQGAPLFGSAGTPLIWATGQAQEGKAVSLGLSNGLAAAPCVLLIGLQPLLADFKGGTLVPDPQWASPPLVTDAIGEVQMDGTWPPGAPPGTALYFQWWITDPGAIEGWAATAGLKVIVH